VTVVTVQGGDAHFLSKLILNIENKFWIFFAFTFKNQINIFSFSRYHHQWVELIPQNRFTPERYKKGYGGRVGGLTFPK
jgi:hypothetical protein